MKANQYKGNFILENCRKQLAEYYAIPSWEKNKIRTSKTEDFITLTRKQMGTTLIPKHIKEFLRKQEVITLVEPMLKDPKLMSVINEGDEILDKEFMMEYYFGRCKDYLFENAGLYSTQRAYNFIAQVMEVDILRLGFEFRDTYSYGSILTFCTDDTPDNKLTSNFEQARPLGLETMGVAIEHIKWLIDIMTRGLRITPFIDYVNKHERYAPIGILGDPREGMLHKIYLAKLALISPRVSPNDSLED